MVAISGKQVKRKKSSDGWAIVSKNPSPERVIETLDKAWISTHLVGSQKRRLAKRLGLPKDYFGS